MPLCLRRTLVVLRQFQDPSQQLFGAAIAQPYSGMSREPFQAELAPTRRNAIGSDRICWLSPRGVMLVDRVPTKTHPVRPGRVTLIVKELNYAMEPVETFPGISVRSASACTPGRADMFPRLYWHGMLRGRA